jgi:hypothetical protein
MGESLGELEHAALGNAIHAARECSIVVLVQVIERTRDQ